MEINVTGQNNKEFYDGMESYSQHITTKELSNTSGQFYKLKQKKRI